MIVPCVYLDNSELSDSAFLCTPRYVFFDIFENFRYFLFSEKTFFTKLFFDHVKIQKFPQNWIFRFFLRFLEKIFKILIFSKYVRKLQNDNFLVFRWFLKNRKIFDFWLFFIDIFFDAFFLNKSLNRSAPQRKILK